MRFRTIIFAPHALARAAVRGRGGAVSKSGALKTRARHYREFATMLDEQTAAICRDLADRYDREAAESEAAERMAGLRPPRPA